MNSPKTLQELFSDPKRWTQGASARDAENYHVDLLSPNAHCFCLSAGLFKVYGNAGYDDAKAKVNKVLGFEPTSCQFVAWNDDPARTIADIQRLVKEANV